MNCLPYSNTAYLQGFQVQITSQSGEMTAIQNRVAGLLQELEYSDRDLFSVRLALEEALVNAIKHGNRKDPNKNVRIGCLIDTQKVRIEVEDRGAGFEVEQVPAPIADDNLKKPNGRGILLLRTFMNAVEYNERGNRLVMERYRESA